MDFIRRRILDLDSHILTSFLPVYTRALLKWTAFGTLRAGADTEAALFTNVVEAEFPEMQPPHRDTIHRSARKGYVPKSAVAKMLILRFCTHGAHSLLRMPRSE